MESFCAKVGKQNAMEKNVNNKKENDSFIKASFTIFNKYIICRNFGQVKINNY